MIQILEEIAREAKKRKTSSILDAYRLLSRNILVVDKDHLGVRFETFVTGKYHDRFYVIFQHDADNGLLSVWKHTLPSFVPLKQLEMVHLNKNLDVSDFPSLFSLFLKFNGACPVLLGLFGCSGGAIANVCYQKGADTGIKADVSNGECSHKCGLHLCADHCALQKQVRTRHLLVHFGGGLNFISFFPAIRIFESFLVYDNLVIQKPTRANVFSKGTLHF